MAAYNACERNHKKEVVMSRTYRALTTLALSLALVAITAAVAVAADDISESRRALYQSELEQNLAGQAARTQAARTEAAVERARALERQAGAVAAQPVAEDQNDRLLRGIEAAQAEHTQAAVEQARAGERNLVPVVTITSQPLPATPGRDVDVVAVALLGLVGGLLGGAAVVAGTAASRRRHRVVAA
jgi:hypothetical protein